VPLYEFRFDDGGVIEEVFPYPPPDHIERDGRVGRRIPSRFAGRVPNLELQRQWKEQGVVPYEKGMNEAAARVRRDREKQQDEARRKVIQDTLATF
jgi:hypothetical protein